MTTSLGTGRHALSRAISNVSMGYPPQLITSTRVLDSHTVRPVEGRSSRARQAKVADVKATRLNPRYIRL